MTAISQNMYINKLDNIVNKWNNAYHITIKMKSINTEASTNTDFDIANNDEEIDWEYQNTKICFDKTILQIGQITFLLLKNLKMLYCRWSSENIKIQEYLVKMNCEWQIR